MRALRALALAGLMTLPLVAATVPRQAPEFTVFLPKPNEGKIPLSQYRGKVVLVEFLSTTCSHCQAAAQLITKLQAEYGPRGFQAVGVAFNDMSHMLVNDFVRIYGAKYPVGYSLREPVEKFIQADPNLPLSVPHLVFIDRNGVIRQESQQYNDQVTATEANIRKTIEALLAEKPKPVSKKKKAS